jgi:hypothetical protein
MLMPNRSSKTLGARRRAKPSPAAVAGVKLPETDAGKDPAAVALGRKGGLKGGKARAASLSKERRAEIATNAAAARWKPRGP